MSWLKKIISFIASVLIFDILAATVSTHMVLNELTALNVQIPFSTRMTTTLHDIVGLMPTFSIIFGLGFLIAFFAAAQLSKRTSLNSTALFAGAGFVSVLVTLITIEAVLGLTALAAARSGDGVFFLSLCGLATGFVYHSLDQRLQAPKF